MRNQYVDDIGDYWKYSFWKEEMSRGYAEHKSREEIEETIDGENKDIFDSAFERLNERGADWCIIYAAWNISMCM